MFGKKNAIPWSVKSQASKWPERSVQNEAARASSWLLKGGVSESHSFRSAPSRTARPMSWRPTFVSRFA
jgi:hypothetical protein